MEFKFKKRVKTGAKFYRITFQESVFGLFKIDNIKIWIDLIWGNVRSVFVSFISKFAITRFLQHLKKIISKQCV